jgi:hypothetical protein
MHEIDNPRQVPGEPRRRWFYSHEMELIVWVDEAGAPTGFQLCYDKPVRERVLTWGERTGFEHAAVDEDEASGKHKGAPVLVPAPPEDVAALRERFARVASTLPEDVARFVSAKLGANAAGAPD